jgi:hypothetical protein
MKSLRIAFWLIVLIVCCHRPIHAADAEPETPSFTLPATVPAKNIATPGTEWLFDLALTADMLQTLNIHRTPPLYESNAFLGSRPSEAKIIGYSLTCGVLHYLVTRELINKYSSSSIVSMWESGTIGLEMVVVKHNASLGLHFYFP